MKNEIQVGDVHVETLAIAEHDQYSHKTTNHAEDAIFTEWSGFFSCASSTVPEQGISDQKANGSIYV